MNPIKKMKNIYEGLKVYAVCRDINIDKKSTELFAIIHMITGYGREGIGAFDIGHEINDKETSRIGKGDYSHDMAMILLPLKFDEKMRNVFGNPKKGKIYRIGDYGIASRMFIDSNFRKEKYDSYVNWVGKRISRYGPKEILQSFWENPSDTSNSCEKTNYRKFY